MASFSCFCFFLSEINRERQGRSHTCVTCPLRTAAPRLFSTQTDWRDAWTCGVSPGLVEGATRAFGVLGQPAGTPAKPCVKVGSSWVWSWVLIRRRAAPRLSSLSVFSCRHNKAWLHFPPRGCGLQPSQFRRVHVKISFFGGVLEILGCQVWNAEIRLLP